MPTNKENKQKRNMQWAWYLYDFGNSAYAAVILLAVYATYFKNVVVNGPEGSALWGVALTIATVIVAVISPFLGTLADYSGKKKQFLLFMTTLSVVFTALLFLVEAGDVFLGMLFFIIAEIGYRAGQVFYNALLIDVAEEDEYGKVSGNGWAIGSFGGIICLIIVLVLIQLNPGNTTVVRYSLVITAVYYALFALPAFFLIKEKPSTEERIHKNYFKIAWDRLSHTLKSVRNYKEFLKYMLALLIYNNGVIAALDFAAIIGAVLFGVSGTELIIFVIVVQLTNVAGAYVYTLIGEKIGYKNSLMQSLILLLISVVGMMFANSKIAFFVVGGLAGFAMAGVQSLSRTMVSIFAPPKKSTEFYGFFSLTGRSSSAIGPGIMGVTASGLSTWVMNTLVAAGLVMAGDELAITVTEQIGHRFALVTIVLFLVVGLMLLLVVDEKKGRIAAQNGE